MPKNSFHTGDIVSHPRYGKGIILYNKQDRPCEYTGGYRTFYQVYYFKNKSFGYASSLKLIEQTTEHTKQIAKDILQKSFAPNCNKFEYGDTVTHPLFGKGLVLDNGHKRNGAIYYHVYYFATGICGYNKSLTLTDKAGEFDKTTIENLLLSNICSSCVGHIEFL